MNKLGKILGIFGLTVSVVGTGVFAFWAIVLPSPLSITAASLMVLHTIVCIKFLPEFGIVRSKR